MTPLTGYVNERREASISLTIRGFLGKEIALDAIVDTGFDDYLTLPLERVAELALVASDNATVMLADGSLINTPLFEAEIFWFGEWRGVIVQTAAGTPLIGMALLADCQMSVEVWPGGEVRVTPRD